jgi:hypothetical protein
MTVLASCVLLFPRKHVLTFKKLGLFRNFVTKKKKFRGWRCSSSGRAPALQAQSPDFKLSSTKNKQKKLSRRAEPNSLPRAFTSR